MKGTTSSPCHAPPLEVRAGALFVPGDGGNLLQVVYVRERERERELSGASAQIPELSRRQLPRECHGPLASPGTLGTGHAPCQGTHLGLVSVSWETSQRWLQVRGVRTEGQPARGASFPKPSTLGGK